MITHVFSSSAHDLSIVIPAYDEALRLPRAVRDLRSFLDGYRLSTEVIVVQNGSRDATLQVAESAATEDPRFRVLDLGQQRGKGLAVRAGILQARGRLVLFCDADFSMPVDQIDRIVNALENGADVAIASREVRGSQRIGEPPHRHLMGRVFNFVVRALAVPQIEDTQCGFKGFQQAAAKDLFGRQRIDGWAFDVEILMLARRRGYRIAEVPITWVHDAASRVSPTKDTVRMVREILMIRRNLRRGTYD
jgi:glycosyltransferase involved in cell wall biosynthesis